MIVVSDTSPINYLILIGYGDTLPKLFGDLYIPAAVYDELTHTNAPDVVRDWAKERISWLNIQYAAPLSDPKLHLGEASAIALAGKLGADLILLDERYARAKAKELGLSVLGTVGLLALAHKQGNLDLAEAISRLRATSFHISDDLLSAVLEQSRDKSEP